MNLLLLSSSRVADSGYLERAEPLIKQHLGNHVSEVLFIPYAGISIGFDAYESLVSKAFAQFGYRIKSIHQYDDKIKAIEAAEAIAVGGGNTFCLLNSLYENALIEPLRNKVSQGTPYVGWSAGSNIASPSIKTTNDMPIVEPPSFNALSLVPFQINPHYIDGNPPGHNGETREQRISEFLTINPQQNIVGIPEGTALKLSGKQLNYIADQPGYLFSANQGKQAIEPQADLSHLLLN